MKKQVMLYLYNIVSFFLNKKKSFFLCNVMLKIKWSEILTTQGPIRTKAVS